MLWQEALFTTALVAAGIGGFYLVRKLRRRALRLRAERARRLTAESDLRLAQGKLKHTLAVHPDGILISDSDDKVVEVNPALCRMFGRTSDAMIGRSVYELPLIVEKSIIVLMRELLALQGRYDTLPLRSDQADGSTRYYVASGQRFEVGTSFEVLALIREVSDVMREDSALRAEFEALTEDTQGQATDLERAQARAEASEQALADFTASVAHDLRAPIRAVGGFSALVREDIEAGQIEQAVERTHRIDAAALRMDRMLDALTRLARCGSTAPARQSIDMAAAANQAWQLIATADPERHVDCRIGALPPARGDASMIDQVWQNLLDNAWKYTMRKAQPRVAVDGFEEQGRTWYRVTDNGAGFDMRYAQKLFQPFRRMHHASEFQGTGVGLSIVRRIVQAHGGQIRARSEPDTGTVMEFTLDS